MSDARFPFSVFVKPWKDLPSAQIAALVSSMGFNGIELPVRAGFPVNPENALTELPAAERLFSDHGLSIFSVAAAPTESLIHACGKCAQKPIIRDMAKIEETETYLEAERRYHAHYQGLQPVLRGEGVRIGVQNHNNRFISNAAGLRSLLDGLDPKHVGAVWDPAHCALAGELPEFALNLLSDRLYLVNLKNAIMVKISAPEEPVTRWKHYWTSGREGLASWSTVVNLLQKSEWRGPIVLCAEYADEHSVERLTREDIAFARSLFSG